MATHLGRDPELADHRRHSDAMFAAIRGDIGALSASVAAISAKLDARPS